jgi:4-hydroxythreonine-4-phosphate dehydrogenase
VKKPIRIAITTGDVDGIGTEITAKALAKLRPKLGVSFLLWRSPRCPPRQLSMIDRHFRRITVSSWPEALKVPINSHKEIVDICSHLPPPIWVETSAQASHFGHINGMVTAPLSKTAIAAAGLTDIGHTDILKRVSKVKELFMGFIGDHFNVLLATGHIPVELISEQLTTARLERAIKAANRLRSLLDKKFAQKPIALLGLNPHAGEVGLIGLTERKIHLPLIEKLRLEDIKIEGPLVPDAAFFKKSWSEYSVYVANYHDQGLIPFKMIHGQESGIHITLGLPFVRTSVDHGTAKDIFGKNKADPRSMTLAIEWAIRLCRDEADLTVKK